MEESEFREFTKNDLDSLIDELEEENPGTRQRIEELTEQLKEQMENGEFKYVAASLMFRQTPEHNFDTFMDLIDDWLPECDGFLEDGHCSCGQVSLGGCAGSEEQCWKHLGIHESIAEVKTEDLKLAVDYLTCNRYNLTEYELDALERLRREAYWWDEISSYESEEDDE